MLWFLKKENLKYTVSCLGIFIVAWAAAYFGGGAMFSGSIEAGDTSSLYSGDSGIMLFFNNIGHCLLCVIGCGVLTVPLLAFDGITIGIAGVGFKLFGGSFSQYILMLLPHSIFEIPALIISCAAGMKLLSILKRYISGEKDNKQELLNIAKSLIIVLALTVIAAIIEGYLTPIIAQKIGG